MSKSNKKKQKRSSNVSQVKEQNVQTETENIVAVDVANEVEVSENEVQAKQEEANKKVEKNNAKNKKQKKVNGKTVEKKTFGQKCRAIVSELKKVTWPTFKEASKQTGVVLALVLIFGAVLLGINLLLGWLFGLIVG